MGTLVGSESPRSKLLRKLAEDLASPDFNVRFGVALTCIHEKVNSAEAKEYCLDSKLQRLLAQGNCVPLKVAVRRVLGSWAASRLVSLLLFVYL